MRPSPSIVPGIDRNVYLVLDDFGRIGWSWRETHVEETDFETVITDLLDGQFSNPVRVIGFNTAEGWSRDVSEQVADELRQRCADEMREMPDFLQEFMERYARPSRRAAAAADRQLTRLQPYLERASPTRKPRAFPGFGPIFRSRIQPLHAPRMSPRRFLNSPP